jgi:hypothetical protein
MKNFRGMNPASSEINQDPNGALDMVNCDISTIGSVKMRKGWLRVTVSPALPNATVDGVIDLKTDAGEALIVFCGGKVFRVVGTTSTDITAANTITAGFRWRGCQSHDHVFMANGVNQPLVIGLTGNAVTYSDYSKANTATPPTAVTINAAPAAQWNSTGHGLVNGDQVRLQTNGTLPAPFAINTTYFVVSSAPNSFSLAATSGGAAITYTTNGAGSFTYTHVGTDNTPSSWVSKPPHGFVVLNQLGSERMWAWNLESVFYSALYSPWDYVTAGDAGFIDVRPGDGDNVVVVAGSYGYVAIMTMQRTLVYSGTGPTDLFLSHVLPMGCTSPDGVVTIGDDLVFLSPYGPSNLKRFINGTQLIQNMIGFAIAPLMHQTASLDGWKNCVAYHDIVNRRALWWLPQGDVPNVGFVYQYDVQSWPGTWQDWSINCVTRTSANQLVAGTTGGQLMILNQGGSDNGAPIAAHYTTAWFDKGEPERNMTCPFLEMWLRASGVKLSYVATWDYGDLVDAQNIDYGDDSGVWGQNASDIDETVKWWGPTNGELTLTATTKPTANDVSVTAFASVTNPTFAYDFVAVNDLTTEAHVQAASQNDLTTRTASLVTRDFTALPAHTYFSKTLNVNIATINFSDDLAGTPAANNPTCSVDYSIDGGVTWLNIVVFDYASVVLQTYSVSLLATQDETQVRVRMISIAPSHLFHGLRSASQIEGLLSDVWIEGLYKASGGGPDPEEGIWQDTSFKRVRVDIYGIGRVVQFTFQMSGSGEAEILAYRPDLRSKGLL